MERAACLHLTAVNAREQWHPEDVVRLRVDGWRVLRAWDGWFDDTAGHTGWLQWNGLDLNFSAHEPTHSFELPKWPAAKAGNPLEPGRVINTQHQNLTVSFFDQPFYVHMLLEAAKVTWHADAQHAEADFRRALSPALTLYRSLEVLGLESLMCGDCGMDGGGNSDHTPTPALAPEVVAPSFTTGSSPVLRYAHSSGLTTSSPAEALAAALYFCATACPTAGSLRERVQAALDSIRGDALRLRSSLLLRKAECSKHVLPPLLGEPLHNRPLVGAECCAAKQMGRAAADGASAGDAEVVGNAVRHLARPGMEAHALYGTLEAMAWASGAVPPPAPSPLCSPFQSCTLRSDLDLYLARVLAFEGHTSTVAGENATNTTTQEHPLQLGFGSISAKAKARGCRLVPSSGSFARAEAYNETAKQLFEESAQEAMITVASGLAFIAFTHWRRRSYQVQLLPVVILLCKRYVPWPQLQLDWVLKGLACAMALVVLAVWSVKALNTEPRGSRQPESEAPGADSGATPLGSGPAPCPVPDGSASRDQTRRRKVAAAGAQGSVRVASGQGATMSKQGRQASQDSRGAAVATAAGQGAAQAKQGRPATPDRRSAGAAAARPGGSTAEGAAAAATSSAAGGRRSARRRRVVKESADPSSTPGDQPPPPAPLTDLGASDRCSRRAEPGSVPTPAAAGSTFKPPARNPTAVTPVWPAPGAQGLGSPAAASRSHPIDDQGGMPAPDVPCVPNWRDLTPSPAAAAEASSGGAAEECCQQCFMCLDGPRRFGFLHGTAVHTGVCEECSAVLRSRMPGLECPLCREPVEEIVMLF
ncbi:hypothetical protein HYH03_009618 [Edaphochlamys debaryana]|uniref:RING-type domain-containing protein n=1 Tax=Edaphochlamys debaryana TaxID=47281 RepID=A0A835XYU6_9CHLO|nr:hypothetical protein HYH03_009618 [Edaphochlamys debaryana]|eukprot:KAG2492127.1 hypothetical protein HYH03_009618 [Edaphochlamys debaryana]